MEVELGTDKVRVVAYVDEEKIDMTKPELMAMVNDLHDKLQAKQKLKHIIGRMVGFGR